MGVSRVVLGSVTEAVLHATPCPLLTIPPRAGGAGGPFRRVLCAVDFAPSSLATLESAQSMVQDANSELTVVHVIDRAFASGGPPMAARARAEDAFSFLHDRVPVHWCVVRDAVRTGETAAEVLRLAAEEEAHLRGGRPLPAARNGGHGRLVRRPHRPRVSVPGARRPRAGIVPRAARPARVYA